MESSIAAGAHPLEIQTVLREICRNLNFDDLKTLRQVSWAFNRGANTAMCKSAVIRISDGDGNMITDFLKIVERQGEDDYIVPPFMRNFVISSLIGDDGSFWRIFGHSISSLRLYGVAFESRDSFRNAIFRLCPNLVTLGLYNVKLNEQTPEEPNSLYEPMFPPNRHLKTLIVESTGRETLTWMEYLCQFPCIQKLDASHSGLSRGQFFNSLAIARQADPELGMIKDLTFDFGDVEDPYVIMPTLENCRLPLENFHANRIHRPGDKELIRAILSAHTETLKKLVLIGRCDKTSKFLDIFPLPTKKPILPKVESLVLSLISVESPIFLRGFTNLKELDITAFRPTASFEQSSFGCWTLPNCKTLRIFMSYLSIYSLRQLFSRFPNIEKLFAFHCENEKFQLVCELFPKLEYLSLKYGRLDDIGVSGMNKHLVRWINFFRIEEDRWPNHVIRPNLMDLNNLKWLSWTHPIPAGRRHRVLIPDYVSFISMKKLPKLRHLRLPEECTQPFWEQFLAQFPWEDHK